MVENACLYNKTKRQPWWAVVVESGGRYAQDERPSVRLKTGTYSKREEARGGGEGVGEKTQRNKYGACFAK